MDEDGKELDIIFLEKVIICILDIANQVLIENNNI